MLAGHDHGGQDRLDVDRLQDAVGEAALDLPGDVVDPRQHPAGGVVQQVQPLFVKGGVEVVAQLRLHFRPFVFTHEGAETRDPQRNHRAGDPADHRGNSSCDTAAAFGHQALARLPCQ
ncbi:hypothetical protein D3C78_1238950 [compost metagenome]